MLKRECGQTGWTSKHLTQEKHEIWVEDGYAALRRIARL
jgi:hypothetical protein